VYNRDRECLLRGTVRIIIQLLVCRDLNQNITAILRTNSHSITTVTVRSLYEHYSSYLLERYNFNLYPANVENMVSS